MKKLFFLLVVLGFSSLSVSAGEITGTADYTGASAFQQVKVGGLWQFGLNWSTGLEAKMADEKAFKNNVYEVKVPFQFSSDALSFSVTPFYYLKNTSDSKDYNAFGISSQFILMLEDNAVDEIYSHVFMGAAFARQEGFLLAEGGDVHHQYYSQAAYTLGLHKNFYRAFSFEVLGTLFQYPDGVSNVDGWRGILDQQDLVSLQTYEIVHELPKYTFGGRITRMWAEKRATIYLGYRFGEFHTADPEHSFVIGNSFTLASWASLDFGYNHLRTVHNSHKRDIFHAQLKFVF
ncbi:MAG: hypothetical protein J6Y25_04960 [Elusimicrobiaceae bacterium]|nr:hypothetical protein [Elusimicrobiaceae bacterium]